MSFPEQRLKEAGLGNWLKNQLTKVVASPLDEKVLAAAAAGKKGAPTVASKAGQEALRGAKQELKTVVPELAEQSATRATRAAVAEAQPLLQSLPATGEAVGAGAVRGALGELGAGAKGLAQRAAVGGAVGGTTGGLTQAHTQDPAEITKGVLRGALGGVAGRAVGGHVGAGIGGIGGAVVPRVLETSNKGTKAPAKVASAWRNDMPNRFAGVTYDWYDDQGATLVEKFPTRESLPDVIKTASIKPRDELVNEQFALVAIDGGQIFRKYACSDAGTTAMSTIYFLEHGHKLPEEAQKTAAVNLTRALVQHGIRPPAALMKTGLARWAKEGIEGVLRKGMSAGGRATPQLGAAGRLTQQSGKVVGATERAVQKLGPQAVLNPQTAGKVDRIMSESMRRGRAAKDMGRQAMDAVPRKGGGFAALDARAAGKSMPKAASVVDITGQKAPTKVAARSTNPEDYAVVLPDGSMHYPIQTWDHIKTAERFFQEERGRMQPEIRRQFATKLASRAGDLGYAIDTDIMDAGSDTYASEGHMGAAIEMRKVACAPEGDEREFLDGLFEKRAEIDPGIYAEVLRRFDVQAGLDQGWDRVVLDPWASTYGLDKTANVIWEDGADRLTDKAMRNLAENHVDLLELQFTDHMADAFRKDPQGIFKSLPTPQKRILARMAADCESVGETEAGFEQDKESAQRFFSF